MTANPTVVEAAVPLDPSTLTFYRVLEDDARALVAEAHKIVERLTALDVQTAGFHPTTCEAEEKLLQVLAGSQQAWSELLDGLSAVIYGADEDAAE